MHCVGEEGIQTERNKAYGTYYTIKVMMNFSDHITSLTVLNNYYNYYCTAIYTG